jgi:hypothetical protein
MTFLFGRPRRVGTVSTNFGAQKFSGRIPPASAPVAQMDRAVASGATGREFEPPQARHPSSPPNKQNKNVKPLASESRAAVTKPEAAFKSGGGRPQAGVDSQNSTCTLG